MRNILLSDPVADVAEYFFTAYCNGLFLILNNIKTYFVY